MKVIDPGHVYELRHLDGDGTSKLTFVKREGPGYPGNVGAHEGTTLQEVLRVLIDRARYVNQQIPCNETSLAIQAMSHALYMFEVREAKRHGRIPTFDVDQAVAGPGCPKCGHVGCKQDCHRSP